MGRNKRKAAGDDSDLQEDDNMMTDQQREEETMLKHTFNFYMQGKGVTTLERYELPMILDGKCSSIPRSIQLRISSLRKQLEV